MGKKKKIRHQVKKACKNTYVHEFADRVRRLWPDQKIYDEYHRPISQELIDTCAQDMLDDVIAVLAPHFRKPTNEKIARILHDWYDSQDTVNTREAKKNEGNCEAKKNANNGQAVEGEDGVTPGI